MATDEREHLTRREVLRIGTAVAAGTMWSAAASAANVIGSTPLIPTRPFGRTGARVPILGLGGYFDADESAELLARAMARRVTYWEMTLSKGGRGHGAYFRRRPDDRAKVFLLAKARSTSTADLEDGIARALEEASTAYVDFFIVQGLSDPDLLVPAVRDWAKQQKEAGRIRYFGFSTHANMAACLHRAAKLPWIDGVVTTYNYRLMQDEGLGSALEACSRAGIAITSIKSQGLPTNPAADIGADSPAARALVESLSREGVGLGAARLQAVWSDPRVSSVLSMMPSARLLDENAAAARTDGTIGSSAMGALSHHAFATSSDYCAGCTAHCESRVEGDVPIGRVMRYAMYAHGYGDLARARAAFAALPPESVRALLRADYTSAERACPQGLAIGRLMADAAHRLGDAR